MFNGLNNRLANVPTVTGLSNVVADDVITNNLIVDGVDVGTQVAANTLALTGITYTSASDTTTVDNNLTVTNLKTLTAKSIELSTGGSILSNALTITDVELGYLDGVTSNIQTQFNGTVNTTTAQSIGGIKTFTTLPESSVVPTTANQLTNKTYVDSVAGAAISVALTGDNDGGSYYIPYSKTTSATSNVLYIDNTTTPLTYIPSTSTLTVSSYDIRATTTPSTISGSGLNVTYKNNNEFGLQQFIVSTGLGPVTMIEMGASAFSTYVIADFNSELRFRSATAANRSITNTYYNLNDTTVVAGGAAQGRIYSDTSNTYIEGFVGNHNIIGTENSTVSSRQLFNFGSSSASIYSPNLTLSGTTNFNVGQGAGDTSNVIIGVGAPRTIVYNASSNNTIIGGNAGNSLSNIASAYNTFIGGLAGQFVTNSTYNTFIGYGAGRQTSTGIQNTFIGGNCGFLTSGASVGTGSSNICLGYFSGKNMITTANQNTLIGTSAGDSITTGTGNTTLGYRSGSGILSGTNNVFLGMQSGFQTSAAGTGSSNVCVGVLSGSSMSTTTNQNTLVGHNSGSGITIAINNVCLGYQSGFQTGALGTGDNNVCVGNFSGDSMTTTANGNTLIGQATGTAITTGSSNTIVGYSSGTGLTTGTNNVFVGALSGFQPGALGTGGNNTIIGSSAGVGLTSGSNNIFVGGNSGFQSGALGTGSTNTCIGIFSGDSMITTANGNTTYGYNSGAAITTGTNNTIIGTSNAVTLTTGSNNIVIGNGANVLTAAAANVIAIGTTAETMFIQGGFNYNIGSNITATITLTAPLAQFYSVTMAAASQVITLPAPNTASVKGAYVVFKRKTNTTHTFTIGAGAATMIPVNSIPAAATVSIGTGTFNCELICDGVNWTVIQQS